MNSSQTSSIRSSYYICHLFHFTLQFPQLWCSSFSISREVSPWLSRWEASLLGDGWMEGAHSVGSSDESDITKAWLCQTLCFPRGSAALLRIFSHNSMAAASCSGTSPSSSARWLSHAWCGHHGDRGQAVSLGTALLEAHVPSSGSSPGLCSPRSPGSQTPSPAGIHWDSAMARLM